MGITTTPDEEEPKGVKVYFNPWAFTIEQNNEFLRLGYEPIPMRIPDAVERR